MAAAANHSRQTSMSSLAPQQVSINGRSPPPPPRSALPSSTQRNTTKTSQAQLATSSADLSNLSPRPNRKKRHSDEHEEGSSRGTSRARAGTHDAAISSTNTNTGQTHAARQRRITIETIGDSSVEEVNEGPSGSGDGGYVTAREEEVAAVPMVGVMTGGSEGRVQPQVFVGSSQRALGSSGMGMPSGGNSNLESVSAARRQLSTGESELMQS